MDNAAKEQWKRLLAEKERQDRELAELVQLARALAESGRVVPRGCLEKLRDVCDAEHRHVVGRRFTIGLRA